MNNILPDVRGLNYGGTPVRVLQLGGAPWFVAADIAKILGYRDAANLVRRLDDDDRGTRSVSTPSGDQVMTVISEAGLYVAILGSQVEGAKAFKRWVTHEVLPALRRTGAYAVPAAEQAPALPASYADALRELAAQVEAHETTKAQVQELLPKAEFAEAFAGAEGDYSVREAAQALARAGVNTGQNRLMKWLRHNNWVDRTGHPYQTMIENGRLSVRVSVYSHPHTEEPTLSHQTRVTGKGLAELHRLLAAARTQKTPAAAPAPPVVPQPREPEYGDLRPLGIVSIETGTGRLIVDSSMAPGGLR